MASTNTKFGQSVKVHRLDWVADSGGACSCTPITIDGEILRVVTDPGSPAPTDNYDIVANDEDGFDILGGGLANRDTANSEAVVPSARVVHFGAVTFVVSNAGNGGAGVIKVYVR